MGRKHVQIVRRVLQSESQIESPRSGISVQYPVGRRGECCMIVFASESLNVIAPIEHHSLIIIIISPTHQGTKCEL